MTVTADVVSAITAHHRELEEVLSDRVAAVRETARAGSPHQAAVAALAALLATDIVPHARAEEDVLYAAATAPELRPLVTGMIFEHEAILGLVADLTAAATAVDAASVATALREIFVGHVRRENELLLPALAADRDVDLPALLPQMQERFSAYRAVAQHGHE